MSALGRADDDVRRFYRGRGRRMFEDEWLCPFIADVLRREHVAVAETMHRLGRDHLVEVGCGPGRYLQWAVATGRRYDGLDLVPELVERGRRVAGFEDGRRLHVGSAENLREFFAAQKIDSTRALVLFPFNCFGNLARVDCVVRALADVGAPALATLFRPTPKSTELRSSYYRKLGCPAVDASHVPGKGILVSSGDGLRSFAYDEAYLGRTFGTSQFEALRFRPLGEIAHLVTAKPKVHVATAA